MSDAQSFTVDSTEGINLQINILSMIKFNLSKNLCKKNVSTLIEMFRLSHFNKLYEISKF